MTDFSALRAEALEANLRIWRAGLVMSTFGNVSVIDPEANAIAIKPSGVGYDALGAANMVVCDGDGRVLYGNLRPSSDLASHLILYRSFPAVRSVVHTHSKFATVFAQAKRPIPALGTTHADYFRTTVPVTRDLSEREIAEDYVAATGRAIVEAHAGRDPLDTPAALAPSHGPFAWGVDGADAAHNAEMLEFAAELAFHTLTLDPTRFAMDRALSERHFTRKHGAQASYGQCRSE